MSFNFKLDDLTLWKSFATDEYVAMGPQRLKGMKRELTPEEQVSLAQMRACVRVLGKLGALNPDWIKKNNVDY